MRDLDVYTELVNVKKERDDALSILQHIREEQGSDKYNLAIHDQSQIKTLKDEIERLKLELKELQYDLEMG